MELSKQYDPKTVDKKWYAFWEENGFFKPNEKAPKQPFCISLPPPNVTGRLHMGHALMTTLSDILIRFKRMQGHQTLWVPGTDHAGIATQGVVEKHLLKTTGKKRTDFQREDFLKQVWKWKEDHENVITSQIKLMGCSCDWSRKRFTMDETSNQCVRRIFKSLFEKGLIYRGDYLVNWDPVTQTALADDEVEYEERKSYLWHFKYPIEGSSEYVQIATTRPETMLGDTAVAVSPKDERYKHLIGKKVILPIMDRPIPIIEDMVVDPEFGTGIVKITPAHDPNDYQVGQRHKLEMINVLTPDGRINENGGPFQGLSIEQAREAVVEKMKQMGLLEKIEPHTHRVGISYRSKAVIEPYLSKQWFVKMSSFKSLLKEAVSKKQVTLIPASWQNTYFHWIDNLRDWCISRQLWWGHRIPVWYLKSDPSQMLCDDSEGLPKEVKKNPHNWEQDPDVLDTWFSSAFWPFNILNWTENAKDFQAFYPNAVLLTGHDILFFWVARMLFMGKYATQNFPFPKVFLHGLIFGKSYWRKDKEGNIHYISGEEKKALDLGKQPLTKDIHSKWEKLSKSKGNIIDPLEIIHQYGTDAMRMALAASSPQQAQIDLDRRRFEDFKNFTNKVWNGARFVLMNLKGSDKGTLQTDHILEGIDYQLLKLEDRWILSALNRTIQEVNFDLENYAFDHASKKAYGFFWKEFCAYYVELCKPTLFEKIGSPQERQNKQKILLIVLYNSLALLHPMAPFITEELFQTIRGQFPIKDRGSYQNTSQDPYSKSLIQALQEKSIMVCSYPEVFNQNDINSIVEQEFELMQTVLYTLRNMRGEMNLSPAIETNIYVIAPEEDSTKKIIKENQNMLRSFLKTKDIVFSEKDPPINFASTAMIGSVKFLMPLPETMKAKENKRLEKECGKLQQSLEKIQKQLSNENFLERAPKTLVEQQRSILNKTQKELEEIQEKLEKLRL